jgi:hypothetical protein
MSLAKLRAEQGRVVHGAWVNGVVPRPRRRRALLVRGRWNPDFRALHAKLTAAVPRSKKECGRNSASRYQPGRKRSHHLDRMPVRGAARLGRLRETDDGEPIPYSKEKARELLTDPELVPFRDAVLIATMQVAKEGKEQFEADAKN